MYRVVRESACCRAAIVWRFAVDDLIVSAVWKLGAGARQSLPLSCLTLLVSRLAIAQAPAAPLLESEPPFSVVVERDDLAVSCPDLRWFTEQIESHAGKAGHAGHFKVTLTKRGEAWQARIQRWEQNHSSLGAARALEDRSSACQPLAEAVALTIAILADSAQRIEPPLKPNPAGDSGRKPSLVTPAPTREGDKNPVKVWVGAGGGAAMSWISPIAPVLGFSLGLDSSALRVGARLMITTEQKFELDPGRVVVQAWLATVFSCLQHAQGHFGLALCATADAGMLRASAEGFAQGKPSTRNYEGVGLEAQPSWYISDSYRISAALGALLPISRESFSVTGKGVVYIPPQLNWRVLVFSEIGAF